MTPHLLALASALLYGSGDFLGGLATRRAPVLLVVALGQAAGLGVLLGIVVVMPAATASPADLAWGAAAGVFGGAGVGLLYRALAVGTMSVVAPTTAVCAVVVPVLAGILMGETPGTQALAGIGLAVVAITLVSQQPHVRDAGPLPSTGGLLGQLRTAGIGIALASGLLIGLFFLALARTGPAAGLWPLLSARATSVAIFGLAMVVTGRSWRSDRVTTTRIASGGVLDMLANALYLLATHGGPLASLVTLASLYPASTILLARVVLGEQIGRVQTAGIVAALIAVALIVSAPA
ncbi:MAG: EamA family transporter [Vicinamibacterales bacterium]